MMTWYGDRRGPDTGKDAATGEALVAREGAWLLREARLVKEGTAAAGT